jgi:serine/threonine-protein kinase RsbT
VADERNRKRAIEGSRVFPAANRADGTEEVCVPIKSHRDIITARQRGKELAARTGFSSTDLTLIATAISELARNIVLYAKTGEITLRPTQQGERKGITVEARDEGPGIPDVSRALQNGFSTSRSLGLGLPGVRRLMDGFEVISAVNHGTTVRVKKWTIPAGGQLAVAVPPERRNPMDQKPVVRDRGHK